MMIDAAMRAQFEAWTEAGNPPLGEQPLAIAALMAHAAFVAPVRQVVIFDAIAAALAATAAVAPRADMLAAALPFTTAGAARRPLPRALWEAFWAIVGDPLAVGGDPLAFTLRVVALGDLYDDRMLAACEAAHLEFPCVEALLATPEVRLRTADLEGQPPGSLGAELLAMLRANGYDLEVIDADTVVLAGDYPAQNRTNRRILQLHDILHLVAGYGFTGAGETAISGFQLAQFGQNYSARYLATVVAIMAFHLPPLAELLLGASLDGWRHGRATPPLLAIPWHERLATPIEALRSELAIAPFASPAVAMLDAVMPAAA